MENKTYEDLVKENKKLKEELKALNETPNPFGNYPLFEQSNSIMLIINPENGQILKANKAAKGFYLYPNLELMNVNDLNTLSNSKIKEALVKAKEGKQNYFRFQHKMADGSLKNVEVYSNNVIFKGERVLFSVIHDITELFKQEIENKKARYSLIRAEEVANIGHWEFHLADNTVKASAGAIKIYGLDKINQEFTVKIAQSIPLPDYREKMDKALSNLITKGEKYDLEFKIKRVSDGEIRDIHSIAKYIEETNTVFGVIRDITGKKQTADALLRSTDILNSTQELTKTGGWLYKSETGIAYWTKEVFSIHGLDEYNIKEGNKTFLDKSIECYLPEDRTKVVEVFQKCLTIGESYNLELAFIDFQKKRKWVKTGAKAVYRNGVIDAVLGYISDITEEKEREQRLIDAVIDAEKSQKQLNKAQKTAHVGNWTWDIEHNNIWWSDEVYNIFGIDKETLNIDLKTITKSFVYTEDVEIFENFIQKAKNNISTKPIEYRIFKPNGSIAYVFVEIDDIQYRQNGNVIGFSGIIKEITNFKLIEKQLVEAKEKAEESNRLKTAFLNNISHEFRTPMNGILGFAQLLINSDEKDDETKQLYFKSIEESCDKLLDIVTDTVEIAHVHSKQVKMKNERCSLSAILDDVLAGLEHRVNKSKVKIKKSLKCKNGDLFLFSDKQKINRSLKHVIGNAIKFTVQGSISVICEPIGNMVKISVKDTGIGITPQMQKKIFEPYRQGANDLTQILGGNGLGLPIAKSYIEKLGGRISLSSEQNKGTCVEIKLPLDTTRITSNSTNKQNSNNWLSGKTVLVAEDEETNYLYLYTVLYKNGMNVLRAKTGIEAIDFCRDNKKIDIILMDLKMPKMDGYDASRIIKDFRPEIPVIAQTAYALTDDIEKIKAGSFDGFLIKPINKNELVKLIIENL